MIEILRICAKGYDGRQMTLYSDQGYPLSDVIMTPVQGGPAFNLVMSHLWIGVAHEFGCVRNLMRFTTHAGG